MRVRARVSITLHYIKTGKLVFLRLRSGHIGDISDVFSGAYGVYLVGRFARSPVFQTYIN